MKNRNCPNKDACWDYNASRCEGCGAEIVWIKTKAGKAMPCDTNKVTIITDNGETVAGYTPHWATCPAAKTFKKNKGEV